ncbi:hypothetical protein C8R44DRAFT_806429 [Mycena epipterygia]|nr:hypothetical protein C8R44DRAFT_806429 [Mycena epipterygia]
MTAPPRRTHLAPAGTAFGHPYTVYHESSMCLDALPFVRAPCRIPCPATPPQPWPRAGSRMTAPPTHQSELAAADTAFRHLYIVYYELSTWPDALRQSSHLRAWLSGTYTPPTTRAAHARTRCCSRACPTASPIQLLHPSHGRASPTLAHDDTTATHSSELASVGMAFGHHVVRTTRAVHARMRCHSRARPAARVRGYSVRAPVHHVPREQCVGRAAVRASALPSTLRLRAAACSLPQM